MGIFEFGITLSIGVGLTLLANLALREIALNRLLHGILWAFNGLIILGSIAVAFSDADEFENPIPSAIIFAFTGLLASALLLPQIRVLLARLFPRYNKPKSTDTMADDDYSIINFVPMMSDGEVLRPSFTITQPEKRPASANQGYDPHNPVHTLALIFCVYILGIQFGSFVLAGGLSGLAEDVTIDALTLLYNFIPMLIIPLIGVGALTRRSWSEVAERLGLKNLTFGSLTIGVVSAVVLIFVQIFMAVIWLALAGTETYENQSEASQAISDSINTIWLAFGVAFTAAVGEEIAFRGALQPVFGLRWTALIFTLIHMQYTLTPAAAIIFVVALGFGWLRQRYNLYAAIVAHFFYNFLPLLFVVAVS